MDWMVIGQCEVQLSGKTIFYNVYADNRQNITVTTRLENMTFLQVIQDSLSMSCLDQKNLLYYPLLTNGKTSLPVGSASSYRTYTCEVDSKIKEKFCTNSQMTAGCTDTTFDSNKCLADSANTQSRQFICPDMGQSGDAASLTVGSILKTILLSFVFTFGLNF